MHILHKVSKIIYFIIFTVYFGDYVYISKKETILVVKSVEVL